MLQRARTATIAVATSLILGLASASAEDPRGTPEQREACTPDVFRLCSDRIPDAGRITECLRLHHEILSEKCRAVMVAHTATKKQSNSN